MRNLGRICIVGVHLLGLSALGALAQPAGGGGGEVAFNTHCRQCHSFKPKDNRLGPSLHGIIGKKAGTVEGFNNYSESLKKSGVTWDEATLDKFIEAPDKVIPGNNMKPYAGLPEADQRKAIVSFLAEQGKGDGQADKTQKK